MLSILETRQKRKNLESHRQELIDRINLAKTELNDIEQEHYQVSIREVHLREIYRLARVEFPRLTRRETNELTQDDVNELEKWIGRARSNDGLRDIVEALKEIQKYEPVNVSNVYALVQKIIIGGPFHETKKRRKR